MLSVHYTLRTGYFTISHFCSNTHENCKFSKNIHAHSTQTFKSQMNNKMWTCPKLYPFHTCYSDLWILPPFCVHTNPHKFLVKNPPFHTTIWTFWLLHFLCEPTPREVNLPRSTHQKLQNDDVQNCNLDFWPIPNYVILGQTVQPSEEGMFFPPIGRFLWPPECLKSAQNLTNSAQKRPFQPYQLIGRMNPVRALTNRHTQTDGTDFIP